MRIEPPRTHLPQPHAVLAALDKEARAGAYAARDAATPVLQEAAPRGRTGRLKAGIGGRASKTPQGYTIKIGIRARGQVHDRWATVAEVNRFVNKGTGTLRQGGGAKARITPKRGDAMVLPGGARRASVRGQAANAFVDRARARAAGAADAALRAAFKVGALRMRHPR